MTSRSSRRSRRKRHKFVPEIHALATGVVLGCECEDEAVFEGYGLLGLPGPGPAVVEMGTGPFSPEDEATNFIEHCVLVASSSPLASDCPHVHRSLQRVAEGFWPDLAAGASMWFDGEATETVVETGDRIFRIRVREAPGPTSRSGSVIKADPHRVDPA